MKNKKSVDKNKQSGELIYAIDKDGKKTDKFLMDFVPEASPELKSMASEKMKKMGMTEDQIQTILSAMR